MTRNIGVDPQSAFARYLQIADRLPRTAAGGLAETGVFTDLAARFDLILFDAYGVLNVGETAIPGATDTIAALRAAGKAVGVVSNSAAYPKTHMMARYARLGFDFSAPEVTTSREALTAHIAGLPPCRWGLMINPAVDLGELATLNTTVLGDDAESYDAQDGFLLVGADGWTDRRQTLLEASLKRAPRPVLVGNPDLVAPRETGLSREPGWFAHRLADRTGVMPVFLGKPFGQVFDIALGRFNRALPPERVLMVGDTLHTDILGGAQAGFATALVTGYGSLTGLDVTDAIAQAGLSPDFIVPNI
ncbi:Haloacid Dehalogenase Superfamily Class (subfamily) IIA [Sulfitobacter pontiacus]|uniref:Haloacid Dehalogenase Superfamily Class (Subfamily) IIA n=1 Tax=Sulfitobacter pontiacus TaxID=60137 RepID=A0A1H2UPD0_9RHOB|nr:MULTISPECIES: HAD family hydrolase [Sulfitobacter]QPO07386.1 HAD hydrolase-like protein [Sulfitobacter sp. B30-2]SDW57952.1 Haloacid Dehalogenase Superfamily Class (subfamily) IIA [Sulfitobacter pontiacus]